MLYVKDKGNNGEKRSPVNEKHKTKVSKLIYWSSLFKKTAHEPWKHKLSTPVETLDTYCGKLCICL